MGVGDRLSRVVRDRSGLRVAKVARPLHTMSLFALGHGAATLAPASGGERYPLELVDTAAPIVFDVGALFGDYSALARRVLGPAATIHAFEPNPASFAVLSRCGDVHAHQVAVGDAAGEATLFADPDAPEMASLHEASVHVAGRVATATTPVHVVTLDEFCAQQGVERIDLLKIDVEGAELEVLHGARGALERGAIRVVQFEFGYGNVASRTFMRDFYDMLADTRDIYRVMPGGLVPLGPYRLETEVFVSATNYAAVPRGAL